MNLFSIWQNRKLISILFPIAQSIAAKLGLENARYFLESVDTASAALAPGGKIYSTCLVAGVNKKIGLKLLDMTEEEFEQFREMKEVGLLDSESGS